MHRRRALAVGGSVVTLSLAGCLGDDDDTDDSNGSTETDDPSELIESADETLDEAADEFDDALDETDDPLSDSSYAIETQPIEARIDDAESDLAAARDEASDEQLEQIDALEGVAEFFRDFIAVFSAFGDAMDELDTWEQYLDQERWDDAVRAAERAESDSDDAMDHMTVARSTFDDIDTEALDDIDEIERVELASDLDEIDDVLFAVDVLFTGSRQMAEAMVPFDDGIIALEQERFGAAASEFETAAGKFDTAYNTFSEAEDEVIAEFRSDLIDLSCEMDALGDAAEYHALGSESYAYGEYRAGDAYFSDAETAVDRCSRNDIALSL